MTVMQILILLPQQQFNFFFQTVEQEKEQKDFSLLFVSQKVL